MLAGPRPHRTVSYRTVPHHTAPRRAVGAAGTAADRSDDKTGTRGALRRNLRSTVIPQSPPGSAWQRRVRPQPAVPDRGPLGRACLAAALLIE